MITLVVNDETWRTALRSLASLPAQVLTYAAGRNMLDGNLELLVRPARLWGKPKEEGVAQLHLYAARTVAELQGAMPKFVRGMSDVASEVAPVTIVGIGIGDAQEYLWGWVVLSPLRAEPLDAIHIQGRGMSRLSLRASTPEAPLLPDLLQFSRVISGRGLRAFARMHALHVAIIGVSGLGSPAAETLVKEYGVREITLIDPDQVGPENLHRMQGAGMADVGRAKVEAVRDYLQTLGPVMVHTAATEVMRWSALNRLKAADVWISTVDNSPTRAQVQMLAQLYLRPLLDIGVGALLEEATPPTLSAQPFLPSDDALYDVVGPYAHAATPRTWAADIRLATPGVRGGCLACLGGFGDLHRARRDTEAPFWTERPGSSRPVNMAAVHHGLALLENYVAGTLSDASLHLQLDFPADSAPRLSQVAPTPRLSCPVCDLAGRGDCALDRLDLTLNALKKVHDFSSVDVVLSEPDALRELIATGKENRLCRIPEMSSRNCGINTTNQATTLRTGSAVTKRMPKI